MKKTLLSLAVAATVAMPISAMAIGPVDGEVYGKINISAVNEKNEETGAGSEDAWNLTSNASRVGVKGKAQLSENLYAIYKAEFEIYVDSGNSKNEDTFEQRNIYAGLTGNFGTVFAGRHDTVLKLAQNKVDLFNDLEGGDIKNWMSGETRASNIINYTTPTFSGFSGSLMTILGEDSNDDNEQDGLLDSFSVGVTFTQGDLFLALAHDENVDSGSQQKDFLNINRAVASYAFGDLTLGAIIQSAEDGDNFDSNITNATNSSYDEKSYMVSAAYKLGATTLKAQYGKGEYEVKEAGVIDDDFDTDAWSLGVDYKLAKTTKVFAYYSKVESDDNLVSFTEEGTVYGVGMEHKF